MLSHQYQNKKCLHPANSPSECNCTQNAFCLRSMHSNEKTVSHANSITQFVKNQYFFTKNSTVWQFLIIKFFTKDSALCRALNSSPIFAL